jgi:hypothetical protein
MMEDDGSAPPAAAAVVDNRPLNERIEDKNWKTRQTAYEELKNIVSAGENAVDPSIFSEYQHSIAKMVADSNAGALDTGLDTAIAFVDAAPSGQMRGSQERIATNVVDKAFGTRASTLNKGKTLCLKLMEVDETAPVTAVLISKLGDKKPKVPPTCLEIIKEGVALFGARAFPVRDVISSLGPVLNGTNGPAREVALALMVDMSMWIGRAPFNSLLDSVRSAQKTEFEKLASEKEAEMQANAVILVPTLWLRKDRPAPGSAAATGATAAAGGAGAGAVAGAAGGAKGMDNREFLEEVDLNKRLKATDYSTLIADEKWNEQQRALQIVVDIIGPNPKLKAGADVSDLIGAIKGFLRQGHVQLQTTSMKIIGLLCDGLRAEFGPVVRPLAQSILMKLKEKRLVGDVQHTLLLALKYCMTMETIMEDTVETIKSKKNPPHTRVGAMELVCIGASEVPEKFSADHIKPLIEACMSTVDDPDPKVREMGSYTLGSLGLLAKKKGNKSMAEANKLFVTLEQTAPRVNKKVQSILDGSTPPYTQTVAAASAPAATSTSSAAAPAATSSKAPASSAAASASGPVGPAKRPGGASGAAAGAGTAKSATSKASKESSSSSATAAASTEGDDVDDLSMSLDDAVAQLAELNIPGWESTVLPNMDSAKWQEKSEAITAIGNQLEQMKTAGGKYSAPLISFLGAKTGGFKISNVAIQKAVISAATAAATNCGSQPFSRPAAWELIKNFGDKYSDKRSKEQVDGLLTALVSATSAIFVVKRMKAAMDKIKAPVAHQTYLEWLKEAINDIGAAQFPVQFLCTFCKEELENKIASVRTAAIEVLGALFNQLGPRMQAFAISEDMKPQLKSAIEAEFAKVGYDAAAANARAQKTSASGAAPATGLVSKSSFSSLFAMVTLFSCV